MLPSCSPTSRCCAESAVHGNVPHSETFVRWLPGTPKFLAPIQREAELKMQWKASFEALYKAPKAPMAASTDDISAILVNPPQSPTPDIKAESEADAP